MVYFLRSFKTWCTLIGALWVCLFTVAGAQSEQSSVTADMNGLVPLSNEKLISSIQQTQYRDWLLYQPTESETEMDTSSESFLSTMSSYPVVAIHHDEICLIVLKKQNSEWDIAYTNDSALVRKDFSLVSFSLAAFYSQTQDNQIVDFAFENGEKRFSLILELSSIYPSYFSLIYYDNQSISLNYDRGITYNINYPSLFAVSYYIEPIPYLSFGVNDFSLQQFPLTIQELLAPATVFTERGEAGLYIMPDETINPIISLENGEHISVITQERTDGWEMAYENGQILFVRSHDIIMSENP